jgi:hypothetical protein
MNKLPDRGLGDVIKASRVHEPEKEKRRYERDVSIGDDGSARRLVRALDVYDGQEQGQER